jgi:hypothetical protein
MIFQTLTQAGLAVLSTPDMENSVTTVSDNVDAVSIWSLESLSRFWETDARLFVKLRKEFLDMKWFHSSGGY